MSTLYIRLPSRIVAEGRDADALPACRFALATDSGAVEREGSAALANLGDAIKNAQRVVLIPAAADVTLLRIKTPPLSAARLKAALPNLVEEQVMTDPAACLLVAGPAEDGERTVAVAERAWLEQIAHAVIALGARRIGMVPAQLCLPLQADTAAAVIAEYDSGDDIDLSVRTGPDEGMGLSLLPETDAAADALQTLSALVPQAALALYVPQARVPAYQAAAVAAELDDRIQVFADNWPRWIDGAQTATIDLAGGLGGAASPGLHWQPWRWPLALAALVLLVNIVALNIDWLRMKREAAVLNAGMTQLFKAVYPKETVIRDPLLQMRMKIAEGRRNSGQAAPDDFLVLVSQFGEVMQGAGSNDVVAGLDYSERTLTVKLKPENQPSFSQMQAALASRNLTLSQTAAGVWQIRSAK